MKKSLQMAVITGGFTLAGVLLPQLIALFRKTRSASRRREAFLHRKREELGEHLVASTLHLNDLLDARGAEEIESLARDRYAEKLHLLCRLYFPSLVVPACRYLDAGTVVHRALLDSYEPDDPRSCGAQAADATRFKQARAELVQARDAMLSLVSEN